MYCTRLFRPEYYLVLKLGVLAKKRYFRLVAAVFSLTVSLYNTAFAKCDPINLNKNRIQEDKNVAKIQREQHAGYYMKRVYRFTNTVDLILLLSTYGMRKQLTASPLPKRNVRNPIPKTDKMPF